MFIKQPRAKGNFKYRFVQVYHAAGVPTVKLSSDEYADKGEIVTLHT